MKNLVHYRKLEKQLKKSRGQNTVEYTKDQHFKVSKETYKMLIQDRIIINLVLLISMVLVYISDDTGVYYIISEKLLLMSILATVIVLIGVEGYWRYNKLYPKLSVDYHKGIMTYFDGKKQHTIKVKQVQTVFFSYLGRNRRWHLEITMKHSLETIKMELAPFEGREIIFNLLTGFSKGIRVI